jgi:hypothetical protein
MLSYQIYCDFKKWKLFVAALCLAIEDGYHLSYLDFFFCGFSQSICIKFVHNVTLLDRKK